MDRRQSEFAFRRPMGLKRPGGHDAARQAALELLDGVLRGRRSLDDILDDPKSAFAGLEGRDRAFAHALTATALRRKGEAEAILAPFLQKPLPKSAGLAALILLLGTVQLRFLDVPAHAAINQSVALAHADHKAKHFAGLINAVLRRVAEAATNREQSGAGSTRPTGCGSAGSKPMAKKQQPPSHVPIAKRRRSTSA